MSAALVGVISDTHGLVRPEALAALAGCHRILHAGDVGAAEVLEALARIAPVTAVHGNNDIGAWARELPATAAIVVRRQRLFLLHELALLPPGEKARVVVAGHSHRPSIETRDGVLFVNPGSAGPRRFSLPVAVARLTVDTGGVTAEIVELTPSIRAVPRRH